MRLLFVFSLAEVCALLLGFLAFKSGLASFWGLIALQSLSAMLFGKLWGLPNWWLPILALFIPGTLYTASLDLPPSDFLIGFAILWLIFRSNTRERVPLYLSNKTTHRALLERLPQKSGFKFMDLGSGLSGNLIYLAQMRPDGWFYGVESAPIPFLIGWIRALRTENVQVSFKNIWQENLESYDVVYAFLSPEPMPRLWEKAKAEMHEGSLLISNSFEIPGVAPHRVLTLNDSRKTRLLIWKIGST